MKAHRAALYFATTLLVAALAVICFQTTGFFDQAAHSPQSSPGTAKPSRSASTLRTTAEVVHPTAHGAAFRRWLADYSRATSNAAPDDHAKALKDGVALAQDRRAQMVRLIRENPDQALAEALTLAEWAALPPAIQALVEKPFSAKINYESYPVCPLPGETRSPDAPDHFSALVLPDGTRCEAFATGNRREMMCKTDLPAQGIVLDGLAAIHDSVIHELAPEEVPVAAASFGGLPTTDFVRGGPLSETPVYGMAGGKLAAFANREDLMKLNAALAKLDELPGPQAASSALYLPFPADGTGGFDLSGATATAQLQASSWTETKKKVFFLRVDFPDYTNASYPLVDAASLASTLNTSVSNAIKDMSYGKTWIEATVSSQVTRLTANSTTYTPVDAAGSSKNDLLHADAKAKYLANNPGFDFSTYDIVGVYFGNIGMKGGGVTYSGLAGGSRMWLQNNSSTYVITHEFGHNYGLGHASFWVPSGSSTNPIDPAGASEEYGDPFDTMGSGPTPEGHFHMEGKQRLNWLAASDWTNVTASGTYRVYCIDHAATTGVRGLRVTRSTDDYYWLGYRRSISANNYLPNGAYIVRKLPGQTRSWLLDLTPDSQAGTADKNDCSQAVGKTYADTAANVFITPVARGGVAPNEYLDVRVTLGATPGNTAPTASISGPSAVAARQTAVFTAAAADANGDPLAYFWDFGGSFSIDNNPSVPYAWTVGGNYTVKLTVSDMKGGSVTVTKAVTVTDPLNTWTQRTNTAAGDFNGIAASSAKVVAVGENFSPPIYKGSWAHSTDGITWSVGQFGSNEHMEGISHDGTNFIAVGLGHNGSWTGLIKSSPDGATWTQQHFSGKTLQAVASGGGTTVAVGEDGVILRSTNGTTWTAATSGTTSDLMSVAWGNGTFVAVGVATAISGGNPSYSSGNVIVLTSPDGITWTNRTAGASYLSNWKDFLKVGYGNGRFHASGWQAYIGTSTDNGQNWTQMISAPRYEMTAFAYGNGVQFAGGVNRDSSDADSNLISPDGINWTALPTTAQNDRKDAVFFKNTFITVGLNHSIWQSNAFAAGSAGYVQWRDSYFPDHGANSTATADGDGDGSPNLVEYSLGRLPNNTTGPNGAAGLPTGSLQFAPSLVKGRLTLKMDLPEIAPTDVAYRVEVSPNLTAGSWTTLATKTGADAWSWVAGGTARIVTDPPSGGRQTVYVGDSADSSGQRRFIRMNVTVGQ